MAPNRKPKVGLGTPLPTQASGAQRRSSSGKTSRSDAEAQGKSVRDMPANQANRRELKLLVHPRRRVPEPRYQTHFSQMPRHTSP